jgi:hypothetical protein
MKLYAAGTDPETGQIVIHQVVNNGTSIIREQVKFRQHEKDTEFRQQLADADLHYEEQLKKLQKLFNKKR